MKNALTNSTPTLDAKEGSFYVFFLFTVLKCIWNKSGIKSRRRLGFVFSYLFFSSSTWLWNSEFWQQHNKIHLLQTHKMDINKRLCSRKTNLRFFAVFGTQKYCANQSVFNYNDILYKSNFLPKKKNIFKWFCTHTKHIKC